MIAKAKCMTLVWQVMTTDYFLSLLLLESGKLPFHVVNLIIIVSVC
jgi:hypothetical protein